MAKKSKFLEYLEFIPLRAVFWLCHLVPYKFGIRAGSKLFQYLLLPIPGLRKTAYKNLDIVFHDYPEWAEEQGIKLPYRVFREKIYKKHLRNLGRVLFTLIYYPKLNDKSFFALIDAKGEDLLSSVLEKGKGAICLSLHMGNWEVHGCYHAMNNFPINVIVRPLDNKLLDRYIENFRTSKKAKIISKFDSPKKFFRPLFDNEVMAILADQNTLKHGVFIPFFNKIASSNQGAAKFHLITKAPLIFGYSYYDDHGKIHSSFDHIIDEEYLFSALPLKKRVFLYLFNQYFNLNNKEIPVEIFQDAIDFSTYTLPYETWSGEKTEEAIASLVNRYEDKVASFSDLSKDEKIFFINYFYHQDLEKIIKEHADNWMLVHPRWKKQPRGFKYLYK